MFRYLHAQALPLVEDLASTMLMHGTFTLAPGAAVPPAVADKLGADGPALGHITLYFKSSKRSHPAPSECPSHP
jgi:hypothetical protein